MEMNFPHKHLKRNAFDKRMAGDADAGDHRALLAHAIARQEASRSARLYDAASKHLTSPQAGVRQTLLEQRMAFFAGQRPADSNAGGRKRSFETGCFRPDLASAEGNEMDG